MSISLCLRIAYVVIALSLVCVAIQIGAYLLHVHYSPGTAKALMIGGYFWPLGLYAAAVYRRKLKSDAQN